MSEELRYLNLANGDNEKSPPKVALALLLLGVSMAVLYLSMYFGGGPLHFILFGGGVGVFAVAIFALSLRQKSLSASDGANAIFRRVAERSTTAMMLSDERGSLRRCNRACDGVLRDGEHTVGAAMADVFDNHDAIVRGILSSARHSGFGQHLGQGRDGGIWHVSASSYSPDTMFWQMSKADTSDEGRQIHRRDVSLPHLHVDAEETVHWANAAAIEVLGRAPGTP